MATSTIKKSVPADIATVPTTADLDDYRGSTFVGFYRLNGQVTNAPIAYGALIVVATYQVVIAKNKMYFRGYSGSPETWGSWHDIAFS